MPEELICLLDQYSPKGQKDCPQPTFTKETDLYALAEHIYFFMNGRYPFIDMKNGTDRMDVDELNKLYQRAVHVSQADIVFMWDRYMSGEAFLPDSTIRPSASEWKSALKNLVDG